MHKFYGKRSFFSDDGINGGGTAMLSVGIQYLSWRNDSVSSEESLSNHVVQFLQFPNVLITVKILKTLLIRD